MMTMRRILLGVGILFAAFRASAQPVPNWTSGTFVYDGAGNIVHIGSDSYTYDALSRLISASVSGHSQAFQYDAMGNLTQLLTDGDLTKVVIPAIDPSTNRLLPAKTGATYFGSHDASGNLVSTLSTAYAYDGLNMMKEATGPNGQHDVYVYNADDERIGTIAVSGDFASPTVTPTSYHWTIRGLGNEVLREFDDNLGAGGTHNWSWKEDYIYANGHLLAAETSGATLHFFPDHLGTPRVITGTTGTVISKHTYYPFGDEITVKEQDSETHRFTGHERDPSLDYMHARYYVSSAGRFLSVDPVRGALRWPQSWNRYTYVLGGPMRYSDPTGLFEWPDWIQRVFGHKCEGPCPTFKAEITVTGTSLNFSPRELAGGSIISSLVSNSLPNIMASQMLRGDFVSAGFTNIQVAMAPLILLGGDEGAIEPGEGAETGEWFAPVGNEIRVSRWMSEGEAAAMKSSGNLQVGADGRTYVTELGAPRPGGTGPVRVDFNVPRGALQPAGNASWYQIFDASRPPVTGIVRP
jgi:RHS repeat-associated protein